MRAHHSDLKRDLLAQAHAHGFQLAGVAPASEAATSAAFARWLADGHHGEMAYLARDPARRSQPAQAWADAASVLVVGMNYRPPQVDAPTGNGPAGQIARYARGEDYHQVMGARLRDLLTWAEARAPGLRGRAYVDAGPLLERDLAVRAGLGWFGKNTCVLHRNEGSYFFLGALLLNVALEPDAPTTAHCGTCTRCLDVCPTGAFVAPYVLDARRCISYLTIELRGPIPRDLRPLIGNWVFGCDLCQEVCPWNHKAPLALEPAYAPRADLSAPELIPLLSLTQEEFSRRFKGSPIKRARRRGLLRNVCVALGNSGDAAAVPALVAALDHDEPLVRGHAAWALGRYGGPVVRAALATALAAEPNAEVRQELCEAREAADL